MCGLVLLPLWFVWLLACVGIVYFGTFSLVCLVIAFTFVLVGTAILFALGRLGGAVLYAFEYLLLPRQLAAFTLLFTFGTNAPVYKALRQLRKIDLGPDSSPEGVAQAYQRNREAYASYISLWTYTAAYHVTFVVIFSIVLLTGTGPLAHLDHVVGGAARAGGCSRTPLLSCLGWAGRSSLRG